MDDKNQKILLQRAAALAVPLKEEVREECLECLEFVLGNEHYALESTYTNEVYKLPRITPLPCTPPFLVGVVSIRRIIIPIIDLKIVFDIPHVMKTQTQKIIVLEDSERSYGLIVDGIMGIRSFRASELQTSLNSLEGIRQELFKGLTQEGVILLNGYNLLNEKKFIIDENV